MLVKAIIGGPPTGPHELPFMAYVRTKHKNLENAGACGGVIISNNHVLTAGTII